MMSPMIIEIGEEMRNKPIEDGKEIRKSRRFKYLKSKRFWAMCAFE